MSKLDRLRGLVHDANAARKGGSPVSERGRWQPRWMIEKYHGAPVSENLYAIEVIDGNLLLNEGITELLKLLTGAAGTTPFNNANARLGVGDGTAAAAATQTDLQGAAKSYKAMDATYPQVANQTVTFKATFGPTEGNHAWKEFVADNGATGAKTLNRRVEDHGVKGSGDTWVLTLTVTIS